LADFIFASSSQNCLIKITEPKSMSFAQKSKQIFEKMPSFSLDYCDKFCYIKPAPNPPTATEIIPNG